MYGGTGGRCQTCLAVVLKTKKTQYCISARQETSGDYWNPEIPVQLGSVSNEL